MVDVALVPPVRKLATPLMEKSEPGVEDAMPTLPFVSIVSAVTDDVANVDGEDVAIYKFPAAERNVHGLLVDEPSKSASCGPVDDAAVSDHFGVDVPTPSTVRFVSKWNSVLFESVVASVKNAILFAAPPDTPLPEPTQVLFTAKHPPVRFQPTLLVEVANPETVSPVSVVVPNPVDEMVRGDEEVSESASDVVATLNVPPVDCKKKG